VRELSVGIMGFGSLMRRDVEEPEEELCSEKKAGKVD
jgi:hypothetical protein